MARQCACSDAHPVQIREIQFAQRLDLLRTELHRAQRMLIALGEAAHGIEQHGRDQVGFLGADHGGLQRFWLPATAVRWSAR